MWKKFIALAASSLLALTVVEAALRICVPSLRRERNTLAYRYDARLGWLPKPSMTNEFTGSRTITAVHNSEGFRGKELAKDERPRMMFVGDSFTWGYDVEQGERFTEKIQAKRPEWDVYNLGVSGYGTDQALLLVQEKMEYYQPRVVFFTFCSDNDHEENTRNTGEGNYYFKPYYLIKEEGLELGGVPVPRTERVVMAEHPMLCAPYLSRLIARANCRAAGAIARTNEADPTPQLILAMNKYVASKGALFVVGVEGPHPVIEQFLEETHVPYVDLTLSMKPYRYESHGFHWTPEGNTVVAERIESFLVRQLDQTASAFASVSVEDERQGLIRYNLRFAERLKRGGKTMQAIACEREAARLQRR